MKIINKTSAIEQRKPGQSIRLILALFLFTLLPALAQAQVISTIAGGFPNDGGPATSAALGNIQNIAYDAAGNLYLADIVDHRIRKIDTAGNITTLIGNGTAGYSGDGGPASAALISRPHGILFDPAGNLIFSDRGNHRIRKVTPAGIISTIAGNGTPGYSGDGGAATAATMFEPAGLALDAAGNLYIAEVGNTVVRRVTTTGIIQTVAGTGVNGYNGDGIPATTARLNAPRSLAVDASGNVYIADTQNFRVRKVDTSGTITTIAGNGLGGFSGDGGPATLARIGPVRGLIFDSGGNLLISNGQRSRVRRVNLSTGIITTVAGATPGFNGDGNNALSTLFGQGMTGMLFDSFNNLLIGDGMNARVRKIDALSQIVTTIAGGFIGDGNQATMAAFNQPHTVDLDASGNIYVVEAHGYRVRKIDTTGKITTIAGNGFNDYSGDGGPATSASIEIGATGVAVDASGNVLLADFNNCALRKINTAGIITSVVGNGNCAYSGDGGAASAALLNGPADPTFDAAGNLFFADVDNCVVRKVNTFNIITTVAGNGVCGFGGDGGLATSAALNFPSGIALDAAGNIYIADTANNRVRKVSTSGTITTVAGDGTENFSGDGGPATSASFIAPADVEVNASGTLYISDTFNLRIRKVDASGIITTLAGDGECCYSGDGGAAANARMTTPNGLALDAIGNLYFTDDNIYRIRKITFEPSQAVSVLGSLLNTLNLDGGTTGSLQAKLDSAQKSLDKGNTSNAIKDLENFIKHVDKERGKKLTDEQANQLVAAAQSIINLL
jgi:trimeric autotransporter adhesin